MTITVSGATIQGGVNLGYYTTYATAKDLLAANPSLAGKDGYYYLYPNGLGGGEQMVYCDMTTDGGGWMMVARTHPSVVNYNGQNWGWQGARIGVVNDFTQAYQAGWYTYWHPYSATFTEYIFGNRTNLLTNGWGPFIYKVSLSSYTTFMTSDTQQSGSAYTTLKSDTNVYGSTSFPGMQGAIGFPVTGTANNIYYMRDCCGFAGYGGTPTSMVTTYCSNGSVQFYCGPWCNGSSVDGSNNFIQGGSSSATNTGGTNQYMIMVR